MARPAVDHVFRAPMRARDRDAPVGAGAAYGLEYGVVGIGDVLADTPGTLEDAVDAATREHGVKAGRMLSRFVALPDGVAVWTREAPGHLRLGRIAGPWRYEDTASARAVGIVHVRAACWLPRPFGADEVPAAVIAAFDRGGRNLQRVRDALAERRTAALWAAHRANT